MKKKFVTILALVMLTITTAFANETSVSKDALAIFTATFTKATDVKWEMSGNYYKASFQINGHSLNTLLSEQGEIIAVYRNIVSTELPLYLQGAIYKNYSKFWIADLAEYAINGETRYYLTLENADEKIIMENVGTYDWSTVKKIDK